LGEEERTPRKTAQVILLEKGREEKRQELKAKRVYKGSQLTSLGVVQNEIKKNDKRTPAPRNASITQKEVVVWEKENHRVTKKESKTKKPRARREKEKSPDIIGEKGSSRGGIILSYAYVKIKNPEKRETTAVGHGFWRGKGGDMAVVKEKKEAGRLAYSQVKGYQPGEKTVQRGKRDIGNVNKKR